MATFGSMDHVKVMDVRTCAPVAMDEWDQWGAWSCYVRDYIESARYNGAAYVYLFKNNRWYYAHRTDTEFKVLTHKLICSNTV